MYTEIKDWATSEETENSIFRFMVYRKVFTPRETEMAYVDQSFFESSDWIYGKIVNVIETERNGIVIEFEIYEPDVTDDGDMIFVQAGVHEYRNLNDIIVVRFDADDGTNVIVGDYAREYLNNAVNYCDDDIDYYDDDEDEEDDEEEDEYGFVKCDPYDDFDDDDDYFDEEEGEDE